MSTTFYPLRVRALRRETADTVSIAFEVPTDLREKFRFTQGQYLTLRTNLGGEEVRRSYSICTGAHEEELRVAIKRVEEGVFSAYANHQLQVGDTLEVMPPQGRFFTKLDATQTRLYVGFAAGSGITPVMSILKTTLVEEPHSRFLLFYGNRGFDNIVFREQLEELKSLYPDRLAVHHVLSRESLGSDLFYGRLNGEKCRVYARLLFQPTEVDAFFLCGPEEMVFDIKSTLEALGVAAPKIHFELFTTANTGKHRRSAAMKPASRPAGFEASVTVIQDGTQFDFRLPSDGSTLLDAAMRAGADLPFSCKGGVCSTCKAKILEGQVEMDVNYGLEPDEVAAGYVLTCQSHPKTQRVVVSFDA
ncbi:MAG: phenylacetate-CoA oxygenase/reductase subunit PaaK [Saprospiraceae bacterium]|nr:phenylacetate-CoA oxygenase/reductase subunit PaaK [Saprospiraceae bacterium]